MFAIPPRPFLLGKAAITLTQPNQSFMFSPPYGASWRLWFLLVVYQNDIDTDPPQQISPDLRFRLYDADGRAFGVSPIYFKMVTGRASARNLRGTNPINIDYPGGSVVRVDVLGTAGLLPPNPISLTLYGLRGWEGFGA